MPQAGHRAPDADPAFGPRRTDDEQVHRAAAGRPRGDPLAQPSPEPAPAKAGVSDDNPFSEAQFKTLKYHPGFPGRFPDIAAATEFCRLFFPWYNTEHRHGGIAMLTPDDVHHGRAQRILEQRERTLRVAWSQHPERFVRGTPKPQPLPKEVWINPPDAATTPQIAH